jgi:hypothetical protein
MTLTVFLNQLLTMQLTMNEMSVLLELGYGDFSREDLLSNSNRCPLSTYSAPALTRTLQKLSSKNPAIIETKLNSNNKTTYCLIDKCTPEDNPYGDYKSILLYITRSRVLTVNTMRVALQMILNENKVSTTRFLAYQLNLDPDYLAATVLPRMIVVGLLKTKLIEPNGGKDINFAEQDAFPLHGVYLDLLWKGTTEITLL